MKLLLHVVAVMFTFACAAVHAAVGDIGVIVIHGKWGSSGGPIAPLVSTLQRDGVIVSAPEMPWSARRLYDQSTFRSIRRPNSRSLKRITSAHRQLRRASWWSGCAKSRRSKATRAA